MNAEVINPKINAIKKTLHLFYIGTRCIHSIKYQYSLHSRIN